MTLDEFWKDWDQHLKKRRPELTTPWARVEEIINKLSPTTEVLGVEDMGNQFIIHLSYNYPAADGSVFKDPLTIRTTPDGKILTIKH